MRLSAFTFGGGFAILTMMKKCYVEKQKLFTQEEMSEIAVLSQTAPGAVAVNAAMLAGMRAAGLWGGLLAALGTVIPPAAVMAAVSMLYSAFAENAAVRAVMTGLLAAAAAMVADAALTMIGWLWHENSRLLWILCAGSLLAVRLLGVSSAVTLCICAAAALIARRRGKELP